MLFNSLDFFLFFIIVTAAYFMLPHKYRWFLLLTASCYFYAAFVPIYILILFFTILIDYYAGIYIERAQGKMRKRILLVSIIANVGILAFFKYFNFFIDNINSVTSFFGSSTSLPLLSILLPIGLSFHTFQAMSYTIEVYRGNQKSEKHFGIYALYVMFYPQLVAGPIERPQNVLHQFHECHFFDSEKFWIGIRLMLWGLFKKVVIADRLSILVDRVYDSPENYHSGLLFVAMLFFAIQIYCDFSGYSDMAIGAAKTMGFELMTNFNRPYFAINIKQFWDRWHMSLSTWFRDYVYIPLGGNRVSLGKTYRNIAIVFILSGFWHGANWNFIVWGALHALFLLIYINVSKTKFSSIFAANKLLIFVSWFFTFFMVVMAWVFFRASDLDAALGFINSLFNNLAKDFNLRIDKDGLNAGFGMFSYIVSIVSIFFMVIFELKFTPRFEDKVTLKFDVLIVLTLVLMILFFGVFQEASFIYFQF